MSVSLARRTKCRSRAAAGPGIKSIVGAISATTVTYDFHRMIDGATRVKCSEFGEAMVEQRADRT